MENWAQKDFQNGVEIIYSLGRNVVRLRCKEEQREDKVATEYTQDMEKIIK
jgi:hypothetical protein